MSHNNWSRKSLINALQADDVKSCLARLQRMGFLDENYDLTSKAKNWGEGFGNHTEVKTKEENGKA
jgi:hypothetical protein